MSHYKFLTLLMLAFLAILPGGNQRPTTQSASANHQTYNRAIMVGGTCGACALNIAGSNASVTGGTHSNDCTSVPADSVGNIGGPNTVVATDCPAGNCIVPAPNVVAPFAIPAIYSANEFDNSGDPYVIVAQANGDYYNFAGNTTLPNATLTESAMASGALVYVNGDVTLEGDSLSSANYLLTIVATGMISQSGNLDGKTFNSYLETAMGSPQYSLLFFSSYNLASCNPNANGVDLRSSLTLNGMIYTPHSRVEIVADTITVNGAIWANVVALSSNNTTINHPDADPHTATPTPSNTPTATATVTPTSTPTFCVTATPEQLPRVEPVISPTGLLTQTIYVTSNNTTKVTVTSESGTFEDTSAPFEVVIDLLPNTTHHLTVTAYISAPNLCAGYTRSTTVDRFGSSLTIVQATPTETATPTLTPSLTPSYTATLIPPSHTPSATLTGSATSVPPSNTATLTPTCAIVATAPNLISPVHRAHTTDTTPTFTWSSVSGAQSYRLMIYRADRSFEYKKRVFTPTYTLKASEALVRAQYLWRVRSQDTLCTTWTEWSRRNTLFVD